METARLVCDVDAFPSDISFHWRFESDADVVGRNGSNRRREGASRQEDYDLVMMEDSMVRNCYSYTSYSCTYYIILPDCYTTSVILVLY